GGPELATVGQAAGTPGPAIRDVDLGTATLFGSLAASRQISLHLPQFLEASLAIPSADEDVAGSGILCMLTIDTTGYDHGTWDLPLAAPLLYWDTGSVSTWWR